MTHGVKIAIAGVLTGIVSIVCMQSYPLLVPVTGPLGLQAEVIMNTDMLFIALLAAYFLVFSKITPPLRRAVLSATTASLYFGIILVINIADPTITDGLPVLISLSFTALLLAVSFIAAAFAVLSATKQSGRSKPKSKRRRA